MKTKELTERAIAIQQRFFYALDILIKDRTISTLSDFCNDNDLNRVKYSLLRNDVNKGRKGRYRIIDIEALAALCSYGVSPKWLLTGQGVMLDNKE